MWAGINGHLEIIKYLIENTICSIKNIHERSYVREDQVYLYNISYHYYYYFFWYRMVILS